jgi:hypothetical protein
MWPVPTPEGLANLRLGLSQLAGQYPSQSDQQTFLKRADDALKLLEMLLRPTSTRGEINEARWHFLEMELSQGKTVNEACAAAAANLTGLKGSAFELGFSGLRTLYYDECDSRKPRWWWLPENAPPYK